MPRPKTYVIEQQQHYQNLSKIIKRDFFPLSSSSSSTTPQTSDAIPLTLNGYLSNFKSDQNQVFAELVHADAEDWRQKHEWMEKGKQFMIEADKEKREDKPFTNMIKRNPVLKQIDFGNTRQEAKNGVFFSPDVETKSYNNIQHDRLKKVDYANTRIQTEQIERAKVYKLHHTNDPNLQKVPQTPVLQGRGTRNNESGDYSIKRMPSPEPQKMPIMTWGQIESTPIRISSDADFRIQERSTRELLHEEMTNKITKQKAITKTKKEQLKLKIMSSSRVQGSSYRKVSVAREASEKRTIK